LNMEALNVKNLSYSYEENRSILRDVNFSLAKGKYTCLVGANGSGKSTIAKIVIGLLAGFKGDIIVDGLPLTVENLAVIRDKIGIVFQNPDNQFIGSTVEDDIAFGLENHQVPTEEMPKIVYKYAQEVKMADFLQAEPSRLSGGQKQRVAIAGVLAMDPELIVFDEATSMLDPQGKKEILRIIKNLNKMQNKTILSITHDMEEINASDQVLVLDQGTIVFSGTPNELVKKEELLKEAKLRLPFVSYFAKNFNKKGHDIALSLTLNQLVEELWQLNSKK